MGDVRLFWRKREVEMVVEEDCKLLFHLLGETTGAGNADQPIVGVPHVFNADKRRVIHSHRWNASDFSYQFPKRFGACGSFLDEAGFVGRQFLIFWVCLFLFAPTLFAHAYLLYFFVQFVQVDVREDRACQTALGASSQTVMCCSLQVEISCSEQFPDEIEEAFISDFFSEQVNQGPVFDVVEA